MFDIRKPESSRSHRVEAKASAQEQFEFARLYAPARPDNQVDNRASRCRGTLASVRGSLVVSFDAHICPPVWQTI
jgi:hypothetical protein